MFVATYVSKLNMRRTNMMLAMFATLATMAALPGSAAFSSSLPSHMLQLRTGAFCKGPPPLNFLKRRVNTEGVAGFKMELLGKRYWMWNVSEWAFDKFIALTQVPVRRAVHRSALPAMCHRTAVSTVIVMAIVTVMAMHVNSRTSILVLFGGV